MTFPPWQIVLIVAEWGLKVMMLFVIVMRQRRPATCLAWLVVVFFLPGVGIVLYLMIGEHWLGRRKLGRRRRARAQWCGASPPWLQAGADVSARLSEDGRVLIRLAERAGGLPVVGGNALQFVAETDDVIDLLVADIDAATEHVHLLFYIFQDDPVGRRVGEALVAAAGRGVTCRVLADHVGSWGMFRTLAPQLREGGVRVEPVLPVSLFRRPLARLDLRNHRKLAVVDGRVAYTGSQNLIEGTFGPRKAGAWADVTARVTGPVVRQLQVVFLEDWFHETGEMLPGQEHCPPGDAVGEVAVQVVPTGPDQPTEQAQDLLVEAVHQARRHVLMTSPYFVPDGAMLLALRLAAARGVRVDVIVPRRSDHWLVDAAGAYYLNYIMQFGVRVHRYHAGMLHTKVMTIDESLAMFGSANFDIRSFYLNFEMNLLIHDRASVGALRAIQSDYLAQSDPAGPDDWRELPLLSRLQSNLAKLLSPLL